MSKNFVPEALRQAAGIYEQRNKLYGDNYKKFGDWALPLLKQVKLETPHDANRLCLLVSMMNKLGRYVEQFNSGGHDDSLDDLAIYTLMMKEVDHEGPRN